MVDLLRNGQPIFEGKLSSLKRFKDDVREVTEGFECGIVLAGFPEVQEGDIIEAYEIEKIARKL
jgi:translation initiation factor IF-2